MPRARSTTMLIVILTFLLVTETIGYIPYVHKFDTDKINKAVWVKNDLKRLMLDQPSERDFIFSPGPGDNDQRYELSEAETVPYMSFFDRSKRSLKIDHKVQPDKNSNNIDEDHKPKPVSIWQYFPLDRLALQFVKSDFSDSYNKYESEERFRDIEKEHAIQNDSNNTVKDRRYIFKLTGAKFVDKRLRNVNNSKLTHGQNNGPESRLNRSAAHDGSYWMQKYLYDRNTDNSLDKQQIGLPKLLVTIVNALKIILGQFDIVKRVKGELSTAEERLNKNIFHIKGKLKEFNHKYDSINEITEKIATLEKKLNLFNDNLMQKVLDVTEKNNKFDKQIKSLVESLKKILNTQMTLQKQTTNLGANQNSLIKSHYELIRKQKNVSALLTKIKQTVENHCKNKVFIVQDNETATEEINTTPKSEIPTESVKINLLPTAVSEKIKVEDRDILKDRDLLDVDEIVYKYYFNNTFVDKIKENIISNENAPIVRRGKTKREVSDLQSFLVPKEDLREPREKLQVLRKKRFVRRHGTKRSKKQNMNDNTVDGQSTQEVPQPTVIATTPQNIKLEEKTVDPFKQMARNFCKKIVKNPIGKYMAWCEEKALRRLENIKVFLGSPPVLQKMTAQPENASAISSVTDASVKVTAVTIPPPTVEYTYPTTTLTTLTPLVTPPQYYFPDNIELEKKLEYYAMKPDVEGNIYYDEKTAEAGDEKDTGEALDFTGGESNSREGVNPLSFDIQPSLQSIIDKMKSSQQNNTQEPKKIPVA